VIDITTAGARALGFSGLAHVSLVRIGKDSLMDTNAIDP
jgi:hypothetical protein